MPHRRLPVVQLFSLGHLAHFWADSFEMSHFRLVSSGLARAWSSSEQVRSIRMVEHFDSPDYFEL
jgi:hypothetical protein